MGFNPYCSEKVRRARNVASPAEAPLEQLLSTSCQETADALGAELGATQGPSLGSGRGPGFAKC